MKGLSRLEEIYKPTKNEIDVETLVKYVEAHHGILETYTTNVLQWLFSMDIKSLRALHEADVYKLARGRSHGKSFRSILNLKDAINKELSEEES